MIIKKLNIAAYSIKKRIQGYHLLKNPKGTPYTTVKLMKYSENINPKTLDIKNSYEKVTKQFLPLNKSETTEYLDISKFAFYNKKTNRLDTPKQAIYEKYSSNYKFLTEAYGEKGYIETEILNKRDLSPLDYIVSLRLTGAKPSPLTYFGFTPKSIFQEKTLAQTVLENYNKAKLDEKKQFKKSNFWKTLWQNLNQK